MRTVLRADEPGVNMYRLLTDVVVPRPIAWISTLGTNGVGNLAPHSFFSVACADPAIISFTSVGTKDTLTNIQATGEFVVNVASAPLLDAVNNSSADFPHGVDEAAALGIGMEPSAVVRPLRVAASPASLECRLHSSHALGDSTLVLGTVVAVTIQADVLVNGRAALERLEPLSRLGGSLWGMPPRPVVVARPSAMPHQHSPSALD